MSVIPDADVSALLEELDGAEPPRPPVQQGQFLGGRPIRDCIERLATVDGPLTFIVGAGVSIESGLPAWPALIRQMLVRVALREIPAPLRVRWIERVEEEGPLAAASVVEAMSKREGFLADLRASLYGNRGDAAYRPGALAQQIAWAKQRIGPDLELVTLNYDTLVEQALEDLGEEAEGLVDGSVPTDGRAVVRHLHGRLRGDEPTGVIVLSDKGYAQLQGHESWTEDFMRERLEDTTCVFLGLSFTDANVARWLYRASRDGARPNHVALFVRQSEANVDNELRAELESTMAKRWEGAGVEVVWTDFFAELAQVVHEIALRRSSPTVKAFDVRAAAHARVARARVVPTAPLKFEEAQRAASEELTAITQQVRQRMARGGFPIGKAHLGLALWFADHQHGTICRWSSSDRLHRQHESLSPRHLTLRSEYAAVEALTRGAVVELAIPDGRWSYVRGIPLTYADGEGAERTPLGAMTLSADEVGDGPFAQAPLECLAEIDALVQQAGMQIVTNSTNAL